MPKIDPLRRISSDDKPKAPVDNVDADLVVHVVRVALLVRQAAAGRQHSGTGHPLVHRRTATGVRNQEHLVVPATKWNLPPKAHRAARYVIAALQ